MKPHPTEGELAILRVLWNQRTPCTVRDVHEALTRKKDTAYTTVLKMMSIMAEKGLLVRDESARRHLYSATHPEPIIQSSLLKDLLQRAFAGSAVQLVQNAIEGGVASPKELDEIAQMIARAKAQRQRAGQ